MRRCRLHGRALCLACVTQTALFPVEHLAWERVLLPLVSLVIGHEIAL